MSEEIAAADSLIQENAALRARILEWEDCYDRLAGAFELHMDILECKQALADLAGSFYDVVLGESLAELAAARAVVAVVRAQWLDEPTLNAAIEAYDDVTKARDG